MEMYRMFKTECEEAELEYGNYDRYRRVFTEAFNLSFFKPKKDNCTLCHTYENSLDKESIQEQYDSHQLNKNVSRQEKQSDVNQSKLDASRIVVCYDLQATLPTPSGEISAFYYKRKLNCYNFTIFNITADTGHCYFWNETIAKRGVKEIGTAVYQFLEKCGSSIKHVTFYSDNCGGQNKSFGTLAMYLYALDKFDFDSITHKYLIPGHTQNEGDNMHSLIEKEKLRHLRKGPIYAPSQWIPIIQRAKKTDKPTDTPFQVNELSTNEVIDFKSVSKNLLISDKNFRWKDIKQLRFLKNDNFIYYKTDYSQVEFFKVQRRKKFYVTLRGKKKVDSLQKAYVESGAPAIDKKKYDDLMNLCNSNNIPAVYHEFYRSLPSSNLPEAPE